MGDKYNPEFDSLKGLTGLKGVNKSQNDLLSKYDSYNKDVESNINKSALTGKQLKLAEENEKARATIAANEATMRTLPIEYIGDQYPEVGMSRFDKNVSSLQDIEDINTFRANQQSGLGKFSNAMISGLASGVLTAVQDLSLMADLENWAALFTDGIEGVEDNIISKAMKGAKESLYQNMPIYETPGTSAVDKFFKWSSLRGILDSAVGFMVPGAVGGKVAQLGLKGALYAARAARTSQYADMLIEGLGLASKIQKTADITSDTFKIGRAWLKGQDYASSMIGGLISNQAEGVMMAIEEGDNIKARYIEDRAAKYLENEIKNNPNFVIDDNSINSAKQLAEQSFNNNKELQAEIGRRQEHFINRNRVFALSDAFGIHGLFKVGKQASRSLLPPIKSTLQNLGSFSSDNLILQGIKEGAEEIGQQAIQDELGYQVGKKFDFQTPEQRAVNDKDFIGRLATFAMSDNALVQGMMGFVSGGAQREFMQLLINSANGDPFNKKQKEKYQKQLAIQDKLIESYAVDNIKSIMDLQSYADSDDNSKTSSIKQSMARDAGFFRKLTEAFTNGTTASLESNIQAINQMTEEEAASKGFVTQAQEEEARKAGDNFVKSYKTLSNEWLDILSREENKYNTLLNYNNAGKLIELNLTANSYSKILNDINNEILKIKSTDQFKNGVLSAENISQTKQEELTKLNQEKEVLLAAQDKITDEVRKAKNIADIEQSFKIKEALLNKTVGNTYYSTIEGQELLRLENTSESISNAIRLINKEFNHISSSKYQLSYNRRAEKIKKQAIAEVNRYAKEAQEDFQREVSNVEDQLTGLDNDAKKEAIRAAKETAINQGNASFEAVLDAVETNIDVKYSRDREGYSVNNVLLKFDRESKSKVNSEEDLKILNQINRAIAEHREEAGMLEQLSVKELTEKLNKIEGNSEILESLKKELQSIIETPIVNEESVEQQFKVLEQEVIDKSNDSYIVDKRFKGVKPGKVAYQSRRNVQTKNGVTPSENNLSPDYNIAVFNDPKALTVGTTLYFKEEPDSQPITVGYNKDGTPIISTWGDVKNTKDAIKDTPIGIYVKVNNTYQKIGYEYAYTSSGEDAENLYSERKTIIESGVNEDGFYNQTAVVRNIDDGVISSRIGNSQKYVTLSTLNNKELRVLVRKGNSDNNAGINTAGKNSVNYNISNGNSLIAGYTYIGLPKNFNGEIEAVPVFRNKLEGTNYQTIRESIKNSILLYLKLLNTPINELSTSENNFVQGLIKLTNDSKLGKEFITYDKGNYKFTLDNLTNYLKLFITITPTSEHSLLKTLKTKQIKDQTLVLNAISLDKQNRQSSNGTISQVSVITIADTRGNSYELTIDSKGNTYFTENKKAIKNGSTSQFLDKLDTILPTMMFNIDKTYLSSKDSKFTLPLLSQGLFIEQNYSSYQEYIKNHLQTFVLETQYKGLDGKQHYSYVEQRQVLFGLNKVIPKIDPNTSKKVTTRPAVTAINSEHQAMLDSLLDDDMIEERSSILLQNDGVIKKGVSELFESNPELANQVYEALGFKQTIIQDNKSYYRGQIEKPTIDKNGNLVLYAREDELYKRAGLKSKGVSMTDDLQSAIEYGNGQLEVAKNLASEGYDAEQELQELSDNGYYLIQIPKDISNEIIKEAGEVKVVGEKIVVPKGKFKIEQVADDVESQVTSQQKQQAQQFYSQYLDTIFPDSKVKDIVYHYNSSGKKFDKFDKNYIGTQSLGSQDRDQGFSFVDNKLIARAYGGFNTGIYSLPKEVWSTLDENVYKQYDENIISVLINPQKGDWKNNQDGWSEIMIKNLDNIHILGSKQDIEGFKIFINERSSIDLNQSKDLQSISDNINNLNITDATVQPLVGTSIITPNVTLISVNQQLEFVEYLTNKIASALIAKLQDNSKLQFSSDYIKEQLNAYKEIFNQAASLIKTTTLKKQHIQEYLNNWNNVETTVLEQLKLISGLKIKQNKSLLEEDLEDDSEELSTEESLVIKSNYDDGFFLTLDYNNIASTEMRLALYGLTNKNKNFYLTPNDPASALPIGIETVLNTVHSITADLHGSYNKMREAMIANSNKYPWLVDLIYKLDKNPTLKNQFVRNMHKYTVNMKKVIDKGNGEYTLLNSNSNSVYFVNLQEWNDLLLESRLVRENKEGQYEFNTNVVKGFSNFLGININKNIITIKAEGLLNKIIKEEGLTIEDRRKFLETFLSYYNIYLTNDVIEDMVNNKYFNSPLASSPSTFGSLFKGPNSLFGQLIYETMQNSKLDGLYSGTLFKNLILQNSEKTSSSFWSRDKTISGYSYPMYLTEETNALLEKNDQGEYSYLQALATLPFSQNNYLIEGLLSQNRAFTESFNYFHLDLAPIDVKGSKDKFLEFQDLSPISQHKIKLVSFWNNGTTIDGQRIAIMFYPTMSDKKVPVLFTIPIRDIPSSPVQLASMLYDSLVSPEVNRMKAWREALENSTEAGELIPNLEWFNEGANVFYRIPELNSLTVDFNGDPLSLLIDFPEALTDFNGISLKKKLDNADKGLGSRIKKIINPAIFEEGSEKQILLKKAIENVLIEVANREIDNQISQWKSDGLALKDIPKEYAAYITSKNEIPLSNVDELWDNIAKDFVLNNMMVAANLEALYISDTADYFEKSAYKEISKENVDWIKVVKRAEANRAKRLSGDKANRYYGDYTSKPTLNVLYAQDVKALPAVLDYYKQLGFSESFIEENLKANTTDGFAVCSIDEHLENLILAGTISEKERTTILKEYYSGKPLSKDTLNIVLNPLKPVFNGKQLVSNATWKEHKTFIKYAQVPLLRQFTEGGNLYLDKLRVLVENSQKSNDRAKQIDIVAFASTTKVGLPFKSNQVNVLAESLYNTTDYESKIIALNRRNFGIQLDKPFDEFKHSITMGTQETSTLFSRIRKINGFKYKGKTFTGRELEKVYENIYKEIYKHQYNKLVDELFNTDRTKIDINKLRDLIYKEGVARGYSINTLLGLDIDPDTDNFSVPLWANPESARIEALLMALIKNRIIKLKTTGKGFIMQSDIGIWEDKTNEEKKDILSSMIFTSKWDGSKLKGRRIDPETGELLGAQILIRSVFEDSFGKTYDIYNYIDKLGTKTNTGSYIIDLNKLNEAVPQHILEGFGFRIPTQDYSSMSIVEIVGFLPKIHGDAIIAPSDFISQMGLDFDIDVLYTYLYKTATVFNKDLGIPVLKRLDELTETDLITLAKEAYPIEKDTAIADQVLDLFEATLKREDLIERLKKEIEEAKLYNELLDIHIAVAKFTGADHKDMSVQNMFSKLLDYGGLEDGSNKETAAKFNDVREQKLGINTFNYLTSQYQTDSYNRANAAKGAVGAFATIKGLFNDIVDKFEIPLQFVDNHEGVNNFYLQIDDFETVGHIAANTSKESPLDIINNLLSTAVDDEKLRVLPRLNINNYTIPTVVGLAGLGFNLTQILNIINQDIIFNAIKILKQKQTTEQVNFKDPDTIFNALKESGYFKEYKNINNLDIPGYTLTTADLEKARTLTEGEFYNKVQAKALYVFIQGLNVGNQLFYIRSNTNMNSKGLPSSIIEVTKLAENINHLIENKIGKNLTKIINTSQLYDNTIAGHLYKYAVLPAQHNFNEFYPYDSKVISAIIDDIAFSITGSPNNIIEALTQAPSLHKVIFKHIKAYVNSTKDVLGYTNLDDIRLNLISDVKKAVTKVIVDPRTKLSFESTDMYFDLQDGKPQLSLATILRNLSKTPYYKNNAFLKSLGVRLIKNTAYINTNNTTGRKLNPNELFVEFSRLITDNKNISFKVEVVDNDNNISLVDYTINSKELGIKLIQYAFLLNNTLKSKNYEKYLPTSLLKALGIFKGMQAFNWNDPSTAFNISTQIVQHNPQFISSNINIKNVEEIIKTLDSSKSEFLSLSTIKDGNNTIIYSFEPNMFTFKYAHRNKDNSVSFVPYLTLTQSEKKYIYKYVAGQNKYVWLPQLGSQFLTEYNPNSSEDITRSIFEENNPKFNGEIISYTTTQGVVLTGESEEMQVTLSTALKEIEESPVVEEYKTIATAISQVADINNLNVTFKEGIVNSLGQPVFGLYKNGNISVDSSLNKELKQDTVLHEAIHATISNIILNPQNNEQRLLKQRLFNVHDLFVDSVSTDLLGKYFKGVSLENLESLKNIFKKGSEVSLDEFIAYTLSSKNFREVLKDQGLWDKVKLLLRNLLKTIGINIKDEIGSSQNLLSLSEKYIFASLDEYMSKIKKSNEPFVLNNKTRELESTDLFKLSLDSRSNDKIFLQVLGLDSLDDLSNEEYQLILNELIKKDPNKSTSEFLGELKNKLCKHG